MSDETQVIDILKETRRNLNAGKIVFAMGEQKGFELERELGSGGMGVVWLARDLDVEGRVALKFLPGLVRDPVAERDLRDEVKNARDLVHENIVSVRRLHKDEASIAVEMEFVDGPSVSRLIAESPNCWLDAMKAAPIVRGLCLAIDYAWKPPRRLVHRDVKPLNLLLNSAGVVKVVDFGIAHSVSETVARLTNVSAAKRVVGSLPYMSPQQLRGDIQHLNDVYSIGATIYELLTGTPPFRAKDVATLTGQINHDMPPSMTERGRQLIEEKNRKVTDPVSVPKLWEEVVAACLAKDSARRPQNAREIAVRLGLVSETVTAAPFAGGEGQGRRDGARRKLLLGSIAAVALVGGAATAWLARDRIPGGRRSPGEASNAPPSSTSPSTPSTSPKPAANQPLLAGANVKFTVPTGQPQAGNAAPRNAPNASEPTINTHTTATSAETMRQSWQLVATAPTHVTVSEPDGAIIFDGQMSAGERRAFPVGKNLLLASREGRGLALEVDGELKPLPAAASSRWEVGIPAARNAELSVREAPPAAPPFEAELAPLINRGEINRLEAEWLRAALGGEKGDAERDLAQALVAAGTTLTPNQWRARTKVEFKPTPVALLSTDPAEVAHAIDLVLPPGGAVMRLIRIEPGSFRHGAPPDEVGRTPADAPAAVVAIAKPFFIGKFEVTQAQFESVMGPRSNPSYWRPPRGKPDWPVDQVTWSLLESGTGFFRKLNAQLDKIFGGVLVADLPTEDEWEYACRAGQTAALNNGRDLKNAEIDAALDDIAHYNQGDNGKPQPVGLLAPNAWGLYDMHGNLREWTAERFVRGGSWQTKAAGTRAASRVQVSADAGGSNTTGFRVILRLRHPTR